MTKCEDNQHDYIACVFLVIVGLLAIACPQTSTAETKKPLPDVSVDHRFDGVATDLRNMVSSGTLQSLSVGVVEDGRVVWAEAWGWADRETDVKAAITTGYGLASVGKAITATGVMTLVERGALDIDTGVNEILGDDALQLFTGRRAPTVRELLNMTSGIPHGAITYRTTDHAVESQLMKDRFIVVFPPGEVFHYSNFSMAVADSVIEQVSGQPFGDFIRSSIFEPLDMQHSSVGNDRNLPAPATRYFDDGKLVGSIGPFPRSSRQMNASAVDLLNFARFHLSTLTDHQKSIFSDSGIHALHFEKSEIPDAHMALGWGNFDLGGGRHWVASSGNDMGVQSHITLLPHANIGVVVLTNSSGYQADEIAIQIADAASPGFATDAIAVIEAFQARSHSLTESTGWAGEWVGSVRTADGDRAVSMHVGSEGDIEVQVSGQSEKTLDDAEIRDGLLTGTFQGRLPLEERVAEEHRIELTLHRLGNEIVGFALSNFRSERGKFELPTFIQLERKER